MFVDRESELNAIKQRLKSKNFEMIVLFGRRRIGKTKLILESVKNIEHIYFYATESDNLKHFKLNASRIVPDIAYLAEEWDAWHRGYNLAKRLQLNIKKDDYFNYASRWVMTYIRRAV